MPCYVHFWENAVGLTQSLAYDDPQSATAQQAMWGGTVRPYPFSAAEYNRRSDPPAGSAEDEALRRKARELAEMAGRRPTGEVVAAIERALTEAAATGAAGKSSEPRSVEKGGWG
jgi:hypothetical protein